MTQSGTERAAESGAESGFSGSHRGVEGYEPVIPYLMKELFGGLVYAGK